jgi:hypothetical protein
MKRPRVAGCRANGNEGVGVSVSAGGRSGARETANAVCPRSRRESVLAAKLRLRIAQGVALGMVSPRIAPKVASQTLV